MHMFNTLHTQSRCEVLRVRPAKDGVKHLKANGQENEKELKSDNKKESVQT